MLEARRVRLAESLVAREEVAPVIPVGRLVLNRNPENFFAETEQVAFCVSNVVPGIDFTDDPLLALANGAASASAVPAPGWWLQLGAFRQRDGADRLQQQVRSAADWLAPLLAVFDDRTVYRVQAGPYASRAEAAAHADRLGALLLLTPLLVERR